MSPYFVVSPATRKAEDRHLQGDGKRAIRPDCWPKGFSLWKTIGAKPTYSRLNRRRLEHCWLRRLLALGEGGHLGEGLVA